MFEKFDGSVANSYRVRNEEVRRRAGIERELASRADQRAWRWFGHLQGMVGVESPGVYCMLMIEFLTRQFLLSPAFFRTTLPRSGCLSPGIIYQLLLIKLNCLNCLKMLMY